MVNTKILLSVVIVLLIGVAAASYQMTSNSPSLWSFTNPQDTPSEQSQNTQSGQGQTGTQDGTSTSSASNQGGAGGDKVKISSNDAKSIAQNSIEQPGAKAGAPQLKTMDGEQVYVVPVMDNGKQAGEIWIDAQTGKVIGGAGGAP